MLLAVLVSKQNDRAAQSLTTRTAVLTGWLRCLLTRPSAQDPR